MAFKMKGSPMQRNFGIKPSPVKAAGIVTGLVLLGKAIAKSAVGKGAVVAGKAIAKGAAAAGKGAVLAGKAIGKGAKGVAATKVAGTTVGKLAGQTALGGAVSKGLSFPGSEKRKVQENNIELRGETYQKRKDKEAKVAEELRQGLKKSDIIDYDFYDEF